MARIKPFLKWAGGKRWFVYNHSNRFPEKYNRYIEPFLGSGAVFFHLNPDNALLGDSNPELIFTYQAIKDNWELVYRYLREHHQKHSREYYYKIRSFQPNSIYTRAARFIYLNRTCWNGLYRVNRQGVFNVPIGTKSSVIFEDDQFDQISAVLQGALLVASDFEQLIDVARDDDFIFVDPPYTVRHNHNAFIKYNETLFSWSDQIRLFQALSRARDRGAIIVGTNAYHSSVRDLYEGEFSIMCVSRNSPISSKASTRNNFDELVFFTEIENG
ncbi:MAG: Dam family site-specific DNA-(adenine-N6)-methyltransferase [Syntrophaceae bacterium]|nr:Dam family site-specific DNA-(adenine-N6)-methyltransferase [Syntrophaceae bacterium]